MEPRRPGQSSRKLLALILLAIAYSGLLYSLPTLTGIYRLDGAIGVVLGLYICSHPAANALDRLLFERGAPRRNSSGRSDGVWLALNVLALLSGWMVIVIGATRFAARVD